MTKKRSKLPGAAERSLLLSETRQLKMARSAHAYVRGNTAQFYAWLKSGSAQALPEGPGIWICGDCHVGNLGPIANAQGEIDVQIRDLDQTVVGNPAHDLIRLGLSLATAARGSDLPGVTTARMIEHLMEGYESAFDDEEALDADAVEMPDAVHVVMKQAFRRSWKHLAKDRIEDTSPSIPLGNRFWPLAKDEREAIQHLFEKKSVSRLPTMLRSRDDNASVKVLDAAYWVKGCSSLGRLRYAVLLSIGNGSADENELCLIDIKEAAQALAPRYASMDMPRENGERVVEGARHLAPHLGARMLAARFLERSVFLRELLPQDLKIEVDRLTREEATRVARFLARVVGDGHARQMDLPTRRAWLKELRRSRSKSLDAPSWLWQSIVELVSSHEAGYLEHCRKYALLAEAS